MGASCGRFLGHPTIGQAPSLVFIEYSEWGTSASAGSGRPRSRVIPTDWQALHFIGWSGWQKSAL